MPTTIQNTSLLDPKEAIGSFRDLTNDLVLSTWS